MAERLIVPKFSLEDRLRIVTGERDTVVETCFKQDAMLSAIRMENECLRKERDGLRRDNVRLTNLNVELGQRAAAHCAMVDDLQAEIMRQAGIIAKLMLTPAGNADLQRVDGPSYPRVNGPVLDACNVAVVWPVKPPPEGDDSDWDFQTQPPPPPREIDPEVPPHWYDSRPMSKGERDAIIDGIERKLDDENVRHAIRPRRPHPEVL